MIVRSVKAFCRRPLLAVLVFLGCSQGAYAQLMPVNFVYTGFGSQSDALKFSYETGFFIRNYYKVSEADVENIYTETNRFLRSAPTPDLEGLQNAWDSIPEFKARSGVDLKKFVDARFVNDALSEIK